MRTKATKWRLASSAIFTFFSREKAEIVYKILKIKLSNYKEPAMNEKQITL